MSIHVIDGRLIVDAEDRSYELRPGQLLVLNPNVVHAVHAVEASGMLLTVTSDDGP